MPFQPRTCIALRCRPHPRTAGSAPLASAGSPHHGPGPATGWGLAHWFPRRGVAGAVPGPCQEPAGCTLQSAALQPGTPEATLTWARGDSRGEMPPDRSCWAMLHEMRSSCSVDPPSSAPRNTRSGRSARRHCASTPCARGTAGRRGVVRATGVKRTSCTRHASERCQKNGRQISFKCIGCGVKIICSHGAQCLRRSWLFRRPRALRRRGPGRTGVRFPAHAGRRSMSLLDAGQSLQPLTQGTRGKEGGIGVQARPDRRHRTAGEHNGSGPSMGGGMDPAPRAWWPSAGQGGMACEEAAAARDPWDKEECIFCRAHECCAGTHGKQGPCHECQISPPWQPGTPTSPDSAALTHRHVVNPVQAQARDHRCMGAADIAARRTHLQNTPAALGAAGECALRPRRKSLLLDPIIPCPPNSTMDDAKLSTPIPHAPS